MYTLNKTKQQIADNINGILEQELITASKIVYPPQKEMGDLSLPCFELAQTLQKNPADIAEDLKGKVYLPESVEQIQTSGPYLNFFLNKPHLADKLLSEIDQKQEHYGFQEQEEKEKIIIEYSNVNTHKEYHVGHLRNICFGEAVARILNANGHEAMPVSYVNDFGVHVAKTLWNLNDYLQQNYPDQNIENLSDKEKGYILGKTYADAAQKAKDNEQAQTEISELMKKIESRDSQEYELWQKTRRWNINQFHQIYQELGVEFQDFLYESEYTEEGNKIVKELLDKGILEKSEGAIIANLEKYNLGVLVIVRSDGTGMYAVADLALAKAKLEKYDPDKSIYVVDNRQTLYFQQLFKILELAGYKQEMVHLAFEFVKLPSGMMSSRSGNVITYEELRQIVMKRALEETEKRHPDWSREKLEETAKRIGFNAIKFEMLKVDADNIITFDIDQALSFDGFTSAYIQYTVARIQSISRKAEVEPSSSKDEPGKQLTQERERDLVVKLAKFPEAVAAAGKNYDPSKIAKYLFDLAQIFNDYYHAVPVLQSEEQTQKARLALLKAVSQTLENGMRLLNLKSVDQM